MFESASIPLRYIDSLKDLQHIALFYEESEYARLIEFQFIRNGLAQDEQFVYATEEDSGSIILKMLTYGISLKYFKTGRLRVYQINKTCLDRDKMIEKCRNDLGLILVKITSSSFRIVSRLVPNVNAIDGITTELELERSVHSHFEDFGGSLICPYDISKIQRSKKRQWMEEIRESHHAVIYAQRFGEGGVFTCMDATRNHTL